MSKYSSDNLKIWPLSCVHGQRLSTAGALAYVQRVTAQTSIDRREADSFFPGRSLGVLFAGFIVVERPAPLLSPR